MKKLIVLLICVLSITSVFATTWSPSSSTEIQQNLPAGYEPSGAVWLHALNKLGTVSDGGVFSTLNVYGTEVNSWTIGGDIEGIAEMSPTSSRVYIVTEYPMAIREVEATTGAVIQTWSLTGIISNPPSTNSALEGIAVIPASDNVYGTNIVVVGMQGTGTLYILELTTTAKLLTSLTPISSGDLSDLYYNTEEKQLWILYDSENVMRKVSLTGTITATLSIPGNDQEGITALPAYPQTQTTLFIAEDSGKFMKYTGFPLIFPVVDSDHDGVPDTTDKCSGYDDLLDTDKDTIPDGCDIDDDNDGVPDTTDKCPGYDDKADKDYDGVPDGCDTIDNTDSDSDGVIDSLDVCPGYDDRADADNDTIPNACDTDDDNDGVLDTIDLCPGHDDKADKDHDSIPDSCDTVDNTDSDADGVIDSLDVCPGYDDRLDADNDAIPNACDIDNDNDGVLDTIDKCQGHNDANDKDKDSIPDACDTVDNTDSDSDEVIDSVDLCPGYNDKFDQDIDGIPDGCDTSDDRDSDNDGLTNAQELIYNTNPILADTDGDQLTDGQEVLMYLTNPLDSDSDNGGVLDGQEILNGTNPLNSSDDVSADPNKITAYSITSDATLQVQYADNTQLTIDPYPGYTLISAGLNSNSDRLIVTNGKYLDVFRRDIRIARLKIAVSTPSSNVMTVTNAGSYDKIVVQYPVGRKTIVVTVKFQDDKLYLTSVTTKR